MWSVVMAGGVGYMWFTDPLYKIQLAWISCASDLGRQEGEGLALFFENSTLFVTQMNDTLDWPSVDKTLAVHTAEPCLPYEMSRPIQETLLRDCCLSHYLFTFTIWIFHCNQAQGGLKSPPYQHHWCLGRHPTARVVSTMTYYIKKQNVVFFCGFLLFVRKKINFWK